MFSWLRGVVGARKRRFRFRLTLPEVEGVPLRWNFVRMELMRGGKRFTSRPVPANVLRAEDVARSAHWGDAPHVFAFDASLEATADGRAWQHKVCACRRR